MKSLNSLIVLFILGIACMSSAQTTTTAPATRPADRYSFTFADGLAISDGTGLGAYVSGKWGFETRTPAIADGVASGNFTFSADLPDGNYRVTVEAGESASMTILAEGRRLMVDSLVTSAGETKTVSFIVNVRNHKLPALPRNAPGGSEVRLYFLDNPMTWDDKLTLWFTGSKPRVKSIQIEPADVPTVFLAGDSTVTDSSKDPGASWGQMLTSFFKPDIAIANHAVSGQTMKSFVADLRAEKIFSQMKKGDFLLIQFGHNDQKQQWPQTYAEPGTTYNLYLKLFIAEARRRGATPILISSMERKAGIDGNTHGDFPKAVAQVAKEEEVTFIDLWSQSKVMYKAMGLDVEAAFGDATHHRNYGAYELAKLVATGVRQTTPDLAKHLKDDFKDFDPAKPDKAGDFRIPMGLE